MRIIIIVRKTKRKENNLSSFIHYYYDVGKFLLTRQTTYTQVRGKILSDEILLKNILKAHQLQLFYGFQKGNGVVNGVKLL